jgi:16S rRNA C967 or C1407 C5-methylase (RsmB/RsmF family)/NOL1/NOP2/fmu family ribosome biogenesis protein
MLQLPQPLLSSLEGVPGFDAGALEAAHQQPAPVSVRLNRAKPTDVFSTAAPVPWCPQGRYLDQRPSFTLDPLWHAGAYYVQEASSMLLQWAVEQAIPDRSGIRALDLCAAPGGKSTLLASLLPADALLISNEVIRSRAGILDENMTRWGYSNTWVTSNDPATFASIPGYFDLMVVDAPCSGSGLFRKDPDALNEWSENAVKLCAARQQRILADAWPSLKEGGVLVYATCSYSPEEDEAILDWLLEDLGAESIELNPPAGWGVTATRSPLRQAIGFRCYPDKVRGEGFFIAVLRKTDSTKDIAPLRWRTAHEHGTFGSVAPWLAAGEWTCLRTSKTDYSVVKASQQEDWHRLRNALYFRKLGLPVGSLAGSDLIPDYALAMSVDLSDTVASAELDLEAALRYLKGEDPGLEEGIRGWHVARYQGIGLGWMKALNSRINNYLPKNLRIRRNIEK